jgi:hypothetical protein
MINSIDCALEYVQILYVELEFDVHFNVREYGVWGMYHVGIEPFSTGMYQVSNSTGNP